MISGKIVKDESDFFEKQIEGIFKKHGLRVELLDKKYKKFKCPDFLVSIENKKLNFICECKCVFSAGVIDNGRYNISTKDSNLAMRKKGSFKFDSLSRIKEVIRCAKNQYDELVKNEQKYKNYPFIVMLWLDFFADSFDRIPKDIFKFKNVSAVAKLEYDYEKKRDLKKMTKEQLEKNIHNKIKIKLPNNSKRFMVLLNKDPSNKFKASKILKNPIII